MILLQIIDCYFLSASVWNRNHLQFQRNRPKFWKTLSEILMSENKKSEIYRSENFGILSSLLNTNNKQMRISYIYFPIWLKYIFLIHVTILQIWYFINHQSTKIGFFSYQHLYIGALHYSNQKKFRKNNRFSQKHALNDTNIFPASMYKIFYEQ